MLQFILCIKYNPSSDVVVSTYQSASGAGARAIEEVKLQSQAILNGEPAIAEVLPYPLAFNLFHIIRP